MGKQRRGRSERKEIKRITDEYLESIRHKLTSRDIELLRTLTTFSLTQSHHLLELCPGTGDLPAFHSLVKGQQRLNDRLRALFDLNLVQKESPPLAPGEGTSKQYVWLDRGGAKLLHVQKRILNRLPANYLHISRCLDLYCAFHRAHRLGSITLYVCDLEPSLLTTSLIPDLVVLYRKGNMGYLYIIEVDRCEKKESDEIAKIQAYKEWQLSGIWLRESWAKTLPHPKFPHILYAFDPIKPSWRKRQTAFRTAAEEARLPFRSCTVNELYNSIVDSL